MRATFLVTLMPFLIQLSSTNSFTFEVNKNITSLENLNSKFSSLVEIIDDCDEKNNITVIANVPLILSADFPPVTVFFANEIKNILEVDLKEVIKGTKYSTPYRVEKEMDGWETNRSNSDEFHIISGQFPRTWLPPNTTKVSATIRGDDGTYFNFYGIFNFKISILDLMVVEEYKNYKCNC